MLTRAERLFTVLAMEDVQYPAVATIAAFGGTTETGKALGVHKANVNRWKHSKSGLIPRWWSEKIKAAASRDKVRLPKPQKVA